MFTMHLKMILALLSCGFYTNVSCITLNSFEKILVEVSQYFELDCVSIISDGETIESLKAKRFFKTTAVQVVKKAMLETLIRSVGSKSFCTYFVFAEKQENLQDLVDEILNTDQYILNHGSWYIVAKEVPEISELMEFDSDVNIVLETEEGQFDFLEMYDLGGSGRVVRKYGSLRKGLGLQIEMENKVERRKDLMGKHFRY